MAARPPRPLPPDGPGHPAHARRPGRAGAGRRRRLGRTHGRQAAADQAGRDRRAPHDHQGRARAPARLVRRLQGRVRDQDPEAAVAAGLPPAERHGDGPGRGAAPEPPVAESDQRRPLRVPGDGRDRDAPGASRRRLPGGLGAQAAPAALGLVLPGARAGRPAVACRADLRLGDDRGWSPALDRLRRHAHLLARLLERVPDGVRRDLLDTVGPVLVAVVGIILRGSAYALRAGGPTASGGSSTTSSRCRRS